VIVFGLWPEFIIRSDSRRGSSFDASLNDPPQLQQLALNFLATFLRRHPPKQRPAFSRHCPWSIRSPL